VFLDFDAPPEIAIEEIKSVERLAPGQRGVQVFAIRVTSDARQDARYSFSIMEAFAED